MRAILVTGKEEESGVGRESLWTTAQSDSCKGQWEGVLERVTSDCIAALRESWPPMRSPQAKVAYWKSPTQGRHTKLQSLCDAQSLAGNSPGKVWSWSECLVETNVHSCR